MTARLAVAIIHGIGEPRAGYSDPLVGELYARIAAQRDDADAIVWREINWADVTQPDQSAYLNRARRENDLDYVRLRSFVVSALGDAAAYRRLGEEASSAYQEIHRIIAEDLADLRHQAGDRDVPLVLLAHSLGSHVLSNYIWDLQAGHGSPENDNRFERAETLAGIVSFGSPIPLFALAHRPIRPIEFPGRALPKAVQRRARWWNYFDPDDILAYPIASLGGGYRKLVNDVAISSGSLLTAWNPASHGGYWDDNGLTVPVADFLSQLLDVAPSTS